MTSPTAAAITRLAGQRIGRRAFLIGCSAAASPLLTRVSFAALPGENRLVVMLLRGAVDGLDLLRPVGDPALAGHRPGLLAPGAGPEGIDLDGFFALHPALAGLMPLWEAGELGFAHAVATPYRHRRSHFQGQDLLENGSGAATGELTPDRHGWLNRAVGFLPGADTRTAVAIGTEPMLILEGPNPAGHWLPVARNALSAQAQLLLETVYAEDPLFAAAYAGAAELVREAEARAAAGGPGGRGGGRERSLGTFVAERLMREARIAAFSVGGWDTHRRQGEVLPPRLAALGQILLDLRAGLGRAWETTLVLGLTEFGRTVRENGSGGTDHGTGGALLLAGGALRGGRVFGRWPGLDEADLFEGRDLMPTGDLRAYAGAALAGLFGLDRAAIEGTVFPGLDLAAAPAILR
jgi:uncharacterized protein (DUF1501 family)